MSAGATRETNGTGSPTKEIRGESAKELPKTFSGESFAKVDHFVNADGLYLFCRYWKPTTEVRALVFHIHGYAEHCGRSKELAEKLMELGIFSFTHDHVGHGESQGLRCHIMDYNILTRDIFQHIDMIRPKYPDVPLFLYGHSMGGGVAILADHERPNLFSGILLSAPFIKPSPDVATPFMKFMAKIVVHIAPRLRVAKLNPDHLSRDKEQVDHYVKDPLNDTGGITVGFGNQFMEMGNKLAEIMPKMKTPVFVAHSERDQICDVGGSKLLVEVSDSKDKTFKLYKEPLHMLEHETPEFVKTHFEEVIVWLKERI